MSSTSEARATQRQHSISIDVEKNSRGYTYSVTIRDDDDESALRRLGSVMHLLETQYGSREPKEGPR